VTEAITQTVIAETIISGRRETGFAERKKANFHAGLNCTTLQFDFTQIGLMENTIQS
jgi:hypothetical protein